MTPSTTPSTLPPEAQATRGRLRSRSVLALALVALLSVVTYALLTGLISAQSGDAATINVSGRQRMLSQRISVMALRYATAPSEAARSEAKGLLTDAVDLMRTSHSALTLGSEALGIPAPSSDTVRQHYFGPDVDLDRRVQAYLTQTETLLSAPTAELGADHPVLVSMLGSAQKPLLKDLNTVVGMYESESDARVQALAIASGILTLVTLALLVAEWKWIFQPMVRQVVQQLVAVAEASRAVAAREAKLRLVLDSTRDALLPLDRDGKLAAGASARATEWLPGLEAGTPYWDILAADSPDLATTMALEFEQLGDAFLPLELLFEQMTRRVTVGARTLDLDYRPIGDEDDPEGYLIVASDVTAQLEAKAAREAALEQQTVLMRALGNRDSFASFVDEVRALLDKAAEPDRSLVLRLRDLHTLKGNFGIYGFQSLAREVHDIEEQVRDERCTDLAGPVAALTTAWTEAHDRIQPQLKYGQEGLWIGEEEYRTHLAALRKHEAHEHLADVVRRWRYEPVERRLTDLGKHATRLADQLGKPVEVDVEAASGLRLPGKRYAELWTSLVHLVRNAVDHGIEDPFTRSEVGKSTTGHLAFRAHTQGTSLVLTLQDDGGGVDTRRLVEKAQQAGLPIPADPLELLFADGLSARDEATEVSGRGLGMAAVRATVAAYGGELTVTTSRGTGTSFHVRLPLDEAVEAAQQPQLVATA